MKIQELFSGPEKWTKGAYARNVNGDMLSSRDKGAVRWCLIGAIMKCYIRNDDILRIKQLICKELHSVDPAIFNDAPETSFETVKELVTKLDI